MRGAFGVGRGASDGLMGEAGAVARCALKSCAAMKAEPLCSAEGCKAAAAAFTQNNLTDTRTVWGPQAPVQWDT